MEKKLLRHGAKLKICCIVERDRHPELHHFLEQLKKEDLSTYKKAISFIEKLKDNPEEFKMRYDDKSKPVGYYARFELLSGYIGELYMPIKAVEAHAKRFSKAYNKSDSPWKSDFDAMAEKTVLKKLIGRYGILSVELRQALKDDDIDYTENNVHDSEPENKEAKPKKEKIVEAEFEEKTAESNEEAEETTEEPNEEETPWD